MYLEIDEDLKTKLEKITGTDYDFKGNYLLSENITTVFEDLISEIDRLEEKNSDMQKEIEENYEPKKIDPYEEYGISEKDFI